MHVNVTLVGLDRLSASLALALKRYQKQSKAEHTFTIVGSDTRPGELKTAEKAGALDNFNRSLPKALENANLVILNAPPGDLEDTYARLGAELRPGVVVLDLSLLKQPGIDLARQHFPSNAKGEPVAYLVGMTPIVNVNGLYSGEIDAETARADLFDNAEILITPDPKCPAEAISLAEDVIRLVGGKARFMDPAEHDGLIAATEILPALLGVGVFRMLTESEGWPELRRMINPSLALMMQSLRAYAPADLFVLFTRNRANLLRHLEGLIGTLDSLRDLLADNEDTDKLEILLGRVQKDWEKWDIKRHSGQWEDAKTADDLGPVGLMGGLLGGFAGRRKSNQDEDEE